MPMGFDNVPYSKKFWRSKSLAKRATARNRRKNFGEKVCVVSVQSSIRNKRHAIF